MNQSRRILQKFKFKLWNGWICDRGNWICVPTLWTISAGINWEAIHSHESTEGNSEHFPKENYFNYYRCCYALMRSAITLARIEATTATTWSHLFDGTLHFICTKFSILHPLVFLSAAHNNSSQCNFAFHRKRWKSCSIIGTLSCNESEFIATFNYKPHQKCHLYKLDLARFLISFKNFTNAAAFDSNTCWHYYARSHHQCCDGQKLVQMPLKMFKYFEHFSTFQMNGQVENANKVRKTNERKKQK